MPRNDQIARQWQVWRLLSASSTPLGAQEIARRLGRDLACTDRTIRRDLEVLRSIGVAVQEVRDGRELRYAILDDGPPLRLDPPTIFALRLAVGLLAPFEGTQVAPALDQLRRELERRVPARVAQHFSALADVLTVKQPGQPRYGPTHDAALATVQSALAAGKTLILDYSDLDGRASRREVDPQGLVYGPRGLYLLATDRGKKGALRTFRLDRVRAARLGAGPARRTAEAERLLEGSLGIHSPEHPPRLVRLRVFDARTARLLEENPWHPSQAVRRKGKHWEVELRLTSFRELEGRILSLGPAAVVVEPNDLVRQVTMQLLRAHRHYTGGPPSIQDAAMTRLIRGASHRIGTAR